MRGAKTRELQTKLLHRIRYFRAERGDSHSERRGPIATNIFLEPTAFWVALTALAAFFTTLGLTAPLAAGGKVLKPGMIVYFVRVVFSPLFATLLWAADAYFTIVTSTPVDGLGNTVGFPTWPIGLLFGVVAIVMAIFTFAMMVTEGLAVLRDEDIFVEEEQQDTGIR